MVSPTESPASDICELIAEHLVDLRSGKWAGRWPEGLWPGRHDGIAGPVRRKAASFLTTALCKSARSPITPWTTRLIPWEPSAYGTPARPMCSILIRFCESIMRRCLVRSGQRPMRFRRFASLNSSTRPRAVHGYGMERQGGHQPHRNPHSAGYCKLQLVASELGSSEWVVVRSSGTARSVWSVLGGGGH